MQKIEKNYVFLENVRASVVVHGPDTKVIACNKAAQNLFGLTKEQMLGKEAIDPFWKFYNEDKSDMKQPDYPVNYVLAHKKELKDFIAGIHRPDREYITWVLIDAVPEFSSTGKVTCIIVTCMDITKLRQLEAERENLIKDLQHALGEVKTLRGILPICSFCKNIRNDRGYYERVENYIHKVSGADFSHTVCPDCMKKNYPELSTSMTKKKE
ncbi:MAG: PAS domain-containing protein [Candidatus Electrothrix sp. GW3-4]|uniref:PAS domain-containing protein n=1 Tax=Candidatus Electrothrix sp. GW3-4 TaxID=3126740 RepID=UPI0030CFCFE5